MIFQTRDHYKEMSVGVLIDFCKTKLVPVFLFIYLQLGIYLKGVFAKNERGIDLQRKIGDFDRY